MGVLVCAYSCPLQKKILIKIINLNFLLQSIYILAEAWAVPHPLQFLGFCLGGSPRFPLTMPLLQHIIVKQLSSRTQRVVAPGGRNRLASI